MTSTPSDDISSKFRELAARTKNQDDIRLLSNVVEHMHNKDREMRKAVTAIAKMHKADNQKRDDIFSSSRPRH